MLERVKYELNFAADAYTDVDEVKPQIVRLINALLLHVQQINSDNQLEVREKILNRILSPRELDLYSEISDEPIDLAEILK